MTPAASKGTVALWRDPLSATEGRGTCVWRTCPVVWRLLAEGKQSSTTKTGYLIATFGLKYTIHHWADRTS
jgi:hypothetical protein